MDENPEELCYRCLYFFSKDILVADETQTHYFCRRYPPVAGKGFPEVGEEDWCGEYNDYEPEEKQ